jgi:hypothetical protein
LQGLGVDRGDELRPDKCYAYLVSHRESMLEMAIVKLIGGE